MMLCLQYSQSGWWSSFALLNKWIVNDINLSMVGMCWTDQGENMHIWTLTYQHKSASNLPWTFQHGKNILIGLFWSHIRHSLSNKLFRNIYRMYTYYCITSRVVTYECTNVEMWKQTFAALIYTTTNIQRHCGDGGGAESEDAAVETWRYQVKPLCQYSM